MAQVHAAQSGANQVDGGEESQAFVSLPGSMSSSSGILDDYAGDPPPKIPHILLQAPQVEIVSTAVDKTTKTKDLILHTVKLTYRGIVWEVQFRRSEVRNLYGILQSLEMKNRGRKFRIGGSGKKGKTVKDELSFRYNERTVTDNGIDEQARADQESGGRGGGVFGTTSSGRQGSIMEGKIPKLPFIHNWKRYRKLVASSRMYKVDPHALTYQRKVIQQYLEDVLNDKHLRNAPELLEALELSSKSFDDCQGPSAKEGYVKVRCSADTSDRLFRSDTDRAGCGNMCGEAGGWNCFCCVCFCFRKKATIKRRSKYWAILKNSALLFYKDRGCEKLMDVVHFQQTTVVSDQLVSTGSRHGVVIIDSSWMAEMKLDSTVSQRQWFTMLKFHIVSSCPWVAKDRFKYGSRFSGSLLTYGSMSCLSQWFLNPKDLWIQIMNSILSAKEEVLIAGWWISPEIYLQRPGMKYPESRLDKIIGKVAKRGVKVKILQYREPKVMPLDSQHTREVFLSLNKEGGHRNIQYLRHGDTTFPYMWSHHEKLVIIDQDFAFVGGVDLSLGRWDTSEYKMCDDGPDKEKLWLGKDYQNPRIKDYVAVNEPFEENPVTGVARDSVPRMPRRDIHMRVFGQTALDVAWHFIQRWNYTRYVCKSKDHVDPLAISGSAAAQMAHNDRVAGEMGPRTAASAAAASDQSSTSGMFASAFDSNDPYQNPTGGAGGGSGQEKSEDDKNLVLSNNGKDGVTLCSSRTSFSNLSGRGGNLLDDFQAAAPSGRRKSILADGFGQMEQDGVGLASLRGPLSSKRWSLGSKSSKDAEKAAKEANAALKNSSDGPHGTPQASIRRRSIVLQAGGGGMSDSGMGQMGDMIGMTDDIEEKDLIYLKEYSAHDENNAAVIRNRRTSIMNQIQNNAAEMADQTRKERMTMRATMRRASEGIFDEDEEKEEAREDENEQGLVQHSTPRIKEGEEADDSNGTEEKPESEKKVKVVGVGDADIFKSVVKGTRSSPRASRTATESPRSDDVDYVKILGDQYKPTSCNMGGIYATRCHLLRSCGRWSSGLLDTERGIQDAYKHFIESAQHYIYIENQFFVSGMEAETRNQGDHRAVKNTLALSLFNRIMKAALAKARFRVYVLIPLLPAMDGPVKGGPLSSIAGVMYWQFRSICRGGNSLMEKLIEHGVNPHEYIKFVGLRTYDKLKNGWQTEQVYIHSKLMIVDDHTTIIGSANLNDRSMMGSKDTEICILTEDTQMCDSRMSGVKYQAGKFSKSLRMQCWAEMCGLDLSKKTDAMKIDDPTSDTTWNYILNLAKSNTEKYEMVFKDLVPSDRIKKADDLKGSGISSGTVKEQEFGRRVSISAALRNDESFMDINSNKGGRAPSKRALAAKAGSSMVPKGLGLPFGLPAGLPGMSMEGAEAGAGQGGNVGRVRAGTNKRAEQAVGLLKSVQGLVVDWPLEFMSEEFASLHPSALPGEIFK